jgi:hypothetical protein
MAAWQVLCAGTLMEAVVNLPEVWITDVPGPYALLLGQSAHGPLGAAVNSATRQCIYRPYIAQALPAARNLVWSLPLASKEDMPQAASLTLDGSSRLPVHSAPPQLICVTLRPSSPPLQQQPDQRPRQHLLGISSMEHLQQGSARRGTPLQRGWTPA